MLRPYFTNACALFPTGQVRPTCQLRARKLLRLLDVWLIECVDAEAFAQRLGRVFPAQKLGTQIEWIGGEELGSDGLRIGQATTGGVVHHRDHATPIFAGALRDQLLDPVRESGNRGGRVHAELVTTRLGVIANLSAELFGGV